MAEPMEDPDLSGIGAAYRRAVAEEAPPEALDAAILAASRHAVGAGPARHRRSFVQRWRMPLAAAAVVVVASSLSLLMYDEGRHETVLRDTPAPMARIPEQDSSASAPPEAPPAPQVSAERQAERTEPVVRMREAAPVASPRDREEERKAENARAAGEADRYHGPTAPAAPAPPAPAAPTPEPHSEEWLQQERRRVDESVKRDSASGAAKEREFERSQPAAPQASDAAAAASPTAPAAPGAAAKAAPRFEAEALPAPPPEAAEATSSRGALEPAARSKQGALSNLRSGGREISGFSGSPARPGSDASALEGIRLLWESGRKAEARAALDRLRCERPGLVVPPEFPVPHTVLPVCPPPLPATKDAPLPDR